MNDSFIEGFEKKAVFGALGRMAGRASNVVQKAKGAVQKATGAVKAAPGKARSSFQQGFRQSANKPMRSAPTVGPVQGPEAIIRKDVRRGRKPMQGPKPEAAPKQKSTPSATMASRGKDVVDKAKNVAQKVKASPYAKPAGLVGAGALGGAAATSGGNQQPQHSIHQRF
jgi:hypothetical protein